MVRQKTKIYIKEIGTKTVSIKKDIFIEFWLNVTGKSNRSLRTWLESHYQMMSVYPLDSWCDEMQLE